MGTRARVLSAFKELHRTCQSVFAGDREALTASRLKINSEFRRFKNETKPEKIEDHIQWATDSSRLLKLTVVQAKLNKDGSAYEVRITKDTHLEENTMFDPYANIPVRPNHKKSQSIDPSKLDIQQMTRNKRS